MFAHLDNTYITDDFMSYYLTLIHDTNQSQGVGNVTVSTGIHSSYTVGMLDSKVTS